MTVTIGHLSPAALLELSDRIERIAPSHRNPHRFYEERSEIAHELREMARKARR